MKKSLYLYVSFLVLGLSLFFIVNSVFAWSLPTANPPQGDLPAPLDTSSIEQTKAGNLNLDNNLKVGGLLRLGLYTSHPTGTNGNLYYNTSDHKFYGYQNNEWKELGGGAGFWLANGNNIYNTNTGNVGIGTTAPGAKLEVAGQVKITGGSPGAGRVLTSDASGLATWQTITGTLPSGTSGQTLRHNGTSWVADSVIYNDGTNVGIGTTSPGQKLHVAGSTQIDGAIVSPEGTLRDDGGGWVRTYGDTGWYNGTYGGGWYMTDSTYLRAYNNKQILATGGINMNSTKITNLATPTAASDAATKGYVDGLQGGFICSRVEGVSSIPTNTTITPTITCPANRYAIRDTFKGTDIMSSYLTAANSVQFTLYNASSYVGRTAYYAVLCCGSE